MKTSELTGYALDWAVVCCDNSDKNTYLSVVTREGFKPSTNWAHGGPIIQREGITLKCKGGIPDTWIALPFDAEFSEEEYQLGETPLIAAMRCFVASVAGDEIKLPDELEGANHG